MKPRVLIPVALGTNRDADLAAAFAAAPDPFGGSAQPDPFGGGAQPDPFNTGPFGGGTSTQTDVHPVGDLVSPESLQACAEASVAGGGGGARNLPGRIRPPPWAR